MRIVALMNLYFFLLSTLPYVVGTACPMFYVMFPLGSPREDLRSVSGYYTPSGSSWNGHPVFADKFGNIAYYSSRPAPMNGWIFTRLQIPGDKAPACPHAALSLPATPGDDARPITGSYAIVDGAKSCGLSSEEHIQVAIQCGSSARDPAAWDAQQCPVYDASQCSKPMQMCAVLDASPSVENVDLGRSICLARKLSQVAVPTNSESTMRAILFSNSVVAMSQATRNRFSEWENDLSGYLLPSGVNYTDYGLCEVGQGWPVRIGRCVKSGECENPNSAPIAGSCPTATDGAGSVCCTESARRFSRYKANHDFINPNGTGSHLAEAVKYCAESFEGSGPRAVVIITQSITTGGAVPCTLDSAKEGCIDFASFHGAGIKFHVVALKSKDAEVARQQADEYRIYDPAFTSTSFVTGSDALAAPANIEAIAKTFECETQPIPKEAIPLILAPPFVPAAPQPVPMAPQGPPPAEALPAPQAPELVMPEGPNPLIPMLVALAVLLLVVAIAVGGVIYLRKELGLTKERDNPLDNQFFEKHGANAYKDEDEL